jgi:hypothetical protein
MDLTAIVLEALVRMLPFKFELLSAVTHRWPQMSEQLPRPFFAASLLCGGGMALCARSTRSRPVSTRFLAA